MIETLKSIGKNVAWFFSTIMSLLQSGWEGLIAIMVFTYTLPGIVYDAILWAHGKYDQLQLLFTNGSDGVRTVVNMGWPPSIANGVAWANTVAPIQEAVNWAFVLLGAWGLSAVIRVVKSFVPTVA